MKIHNLWFTLGGTVTFIIFSMLLSGCASVEEWALRHSGVISEEDIQTYIELRDAGELDEDGFLKYDMEDEDDTDESKEDVRREGIHVTFGLNSYLEISYYLDKEHTKPVDIEACYLKPGECLYASESENNSYGKLYHLDEFRVYECEGTKLTDRELFWKHEGEEDDLLVLQVPLEYTGEEISVIPVGKFTKRRISLRAYYTDSVGEKHEVDGTWIVDGDKVTERSKEVSPFQSPEVEYQYDQEKYSYVSSDPESFYAENGQVKFEYGEWNDDVETYFVELSPVENKFFLDPSQYNTEGGEVVFEHNGRTIAEKSYIPDGDVIQYILKPDPGYLCSKETGEIMVNISTPGFTETQIREAVQFYSDRQVNVRLPQPQRGGSIEYSVDGKPLTGDTCQLSSGTVIKMSFHNWSGWESRVMDGEEYIVKDGGENSEQTVSLLNADISEVFYEVEQSKPELKVVLDETVQGALFGISARGIQEENLTYGEKNSSIRFPDFLNQNGSVVFQGKIGTDQGITVTIANNVILDGYALKLNIVKTDNRGEKRESIRYIKKLPAEEKIDVYEEGEAEAHSAIYTDIEINISKAEVKSYTQQHIDHAIIRVKFDDIEEEVLQEGDILEQSRKVSVEIIPEDGYYVFGSNVDGGRYMDTMTFSKWEKNSKKILDKHPIKKFWHVTLDSSDLYGTGVYKLDGRQVSGTIRLRQDQKLTLEYVLSDPERYEIVRNGIASIAGIVHADTENITIYISEEMDGSTIRPSDYITIEPKKG